MKIKIVDTPTGSAPDWVRAAWVGTEHTLILSKKQKFVFIPHGTSNNKSNQLVHKVDFNEAVAILAVNSPLAARWYRNKEQKKSQKVIKFSKKCCQITETYEEVNRQH